MCIRKLLVVIWPVVMTQGTLELFLIQTLAFTAQEQRLLLQCAAVNISACPLTEC